MTTPRLPPIHAARWIAIAIAAAAIVDPRIPLPRSERPVVRVISPESRDTRPVVEAVQDAGFVVDPASAETAAVLVASAPGPKLALGTTLWALDTAPPAPNVWILNASAPPVRLPTQAVDVVAEIAAAGVTGQTTEVVLEHAGIPVGTARHTWASGETQWTATLRYLPPTVSATALRVRASTAAGESSADDNVADAGVSAVRGPIRVLIVEAAVTWPAVFVRRALEGEPAVAVSSLQRAAKLVATRAGDPPSALTRAALAPFEAVVIGGPDELRAADLDSLRWFVEQRGGTAIFIPDRAPSGRYLGLVGVSSFTSRALETPAPLGSKLQASELLVPARLPPAATVLAAAGKEPIVFSARRGAGAIVFSGALDGWRHRGDAFGEFWRGLLVATASIAPPALEVSAQPAAIRPGQRTRVVARVRDLPDDDVIALPPLTGRVVSPDAKTDDAIRMWPTTEPGVYEGEWRARSAGMYDVAVAIGDTRGDATVVVSPDLFQAASADAEALALASAATGGRAFPIADTAALADAMRQAHPPRRIVRPVRPMRSPWWLVPFAGLLCAEWAIRRRRGLP